MDEGVNRMPFTLGPDSPQRTWHIWILRTDLAAKKYPLCGGGDPLGEHVKDLKRLEDVADEFTGPGPTRICEWVLGSTDTTICRECAELLADQTGWHTAPIQWVPQIGPKRTRLLHDSNIYTIRDLARKYITTETGANQLIYKSYSLEIHTGITSSQAIIDNVASEMWRVETDRQGPLWIVREVLEP